MSSNYDDILHLPHHQSETRPRMSAYDRAAQFSPFAALTGYDAAIQEAGRLTEARLELTEEAKLLLDEKLSFLSQHIAEKTSITISWFRPDERKAGGAYISTVGMIKKLDAIERTILLTDGTKIPLDDIIDISIGE